MERKRHTGLSNYSTHNISEFKGFSNQIDKGSMKIVFSLLGCLALFSSCCNDMIATDDKKLEKIGSDIDYPNSKTRIEVIQTTNVEDNKALLSQLFEDLKNENFIEVHKEIVSHDSFYDPDTETEFSIKGDGMRVLSFRRTKPKPENYYPDFVLSIYKFKTETEAKLCYEKISDALKGGRFPNGKVPSIVTINKNEVFYLSTRAEMFRGYIDEFANRIKNY